jgi:hypothetical protein
MDAMYEETLTRRITVTSSYYKISTDLLGNKLVERGRGVTLSHPFILQRRFWTDI